MPKPDLVPARIAYVNEYGNPQCPEGTIDCEHCNNDRGMCFCEDHCSWEICRLHRAPHKCLSTADSNWVWDSKNMYWVAQMAGIGVL